MVFQRNQIDDELNFHILSLQAPPLQAPPQRPSDNSELEQLSKPKSIQYA